MRNYLLITLSIATFGLLAFFLGQNAVPGNPVELGGSIAETKVQRISELELPELKDIMPPIDQLSELTQKIIGFDADLNIRERNKLVWQLRHENLTKQDFEALFTFLKRHPEKQVDQLFWHSLKNDLLVILIDDGRYKESMAELISDIINDNQQHAVMREYTLQYTVDYFERHWLDQLSTKATKNYSKVDKTQQSEILKSMYKALNWPEGPIAGTSLIRLHEISQKFSFVDQGIIDKETKRMVLDSLTSESSRMAAISIAAERNILILESEVEYMAFNASESIQLRMCALSALTHLSKNDQILDRITKEIINDTNCDKRLLKAAQMSLMKLINRKG
ncbi:MAG: hypothetical protein NE334_01870 [Lentisphaeraceae bacterium]|nr:hypothetical protein [Lentisphaeraceae bacterium]